MKHRLTGTIVLVIASASHVHAAKTDDTVPPVWNIVTESFESGGLEAWNQTVPESLGLAPDSGRSGSTMSLALLVDSQLMLTSSSWWVALVYTFR